MRSETTPRGLDESLSQLLDALERAGSTAEASALQHLLASLERLKAIAWARFLSLASTTPQPRTEPLEDLRHLTPIQVARFLGLKEAYVHELCRARRIPAVKQGKYWMIPVGGLREWLARSRPGIDPPRIAQLPLPDPHGTPVPDRSSAHVEPARIIGAVGRAPKRRGRPATTKR